MKKLAPEDILKYLKTRNISGVSCHTRGNSHTWRLRVSVNGSLKTTALCITEHDTLRDIESQVLIKREQLLNDSNKSALEYLDKFCERLGAVSSTKRNYRNSLKGFVLNNPEANENLYASILNGPLKDSTKRKKLGHIRRFFKWLRENNLTTDCPEKNFPVPHFRYGRRTRVFSDNEIAIVREAFRNKPRALLFFELALCTGARVSSLAILKSDSLRNGRLVLYNVKSRRPYEMTFPLPPDVVALWHSVCDDCVREGSTIFPKPLSIQHTLNMFFHKHFGRDANGELLSLHSLRHTFATRALQANVPIDVVSKLLDHSSLSLTLSTYARHSQTQFDHGIEAVLNSLSKE